MSKKLATVLGYCQDRKGIIFAISDFLSKHNGNILSLDQHIDEKSNLFLFRVQWDFSQFTLSTDELKLAFGHLVEDYSMTWKLSFSTDLKRVAILVSKNEHCLVDLLHRVHVGDLPCVVPLVISNHEDGREWVNHYQIPYFVHQHQKHQSEEEIQNLLKTHQIDLIVLARYMQILSPDFVRKYPDQIINIHHSFLPAFIGARPYHQAYERGVKIIGATAHYVTNQLDDGPIIEQDIVRISHRDQPQDLVQKGKELEKICLARAVKWHLEDRVLVYDNKTVVFI